LLQSWSSIPIFGENNLAGEILDWQLDGLKAKQEAEVTAAAPVLLVNAGFDPWALVDVDERMLKRLGMWLRFCLAISSVSVCRRE